MKINPLPPSTSPCPSCVGSVPFDLLQESEDLTPAEIGVLRDNLALEPWMVGTMHTVFCHVEKPQQYGFNKIINTIEGKMKPYSTPNPYLFKIF